MAQLGWRGGDVGARTMKDAFLCGAEEEEEEEEEAEGGRRKSGKGWWSLSAAILTL